MAVVGSGATLQIGKETIWGTAVAGAKIVNFTSESLKLNADKKTEDTLIASTAPAGKDLMKLDVSGDFSGILRPEFAGYLLRLAFGGADTKTDNSPVTGAYTHSIPLVGASGTLPSFTTIVDRKVAVKKYSGCKIDNFTLEGAAGDYVKFTASIKAKDESTGTLASLSALALQSFKTVNATLTLGGTTYDAKSVKFESKNNLQDVGQTYGSGLYNLEPIHGQREATVDIDLNYSTDTETLFDTNYVTDTKIASIVWTLKSPSVVTGSTNYTVTITLNNVAITSVERNVNGAGVLTAKVSGQALSIGSTEPVTATIIDATSTAY